MSEPALTTNMSMSRTHLETHQSPDPDQADTGAAHRETTVVICTAMQGR